MSVGRDEFQLASRVLLWLLALCWLCAYGSLLVQVRGLVGARGLAPAVEWLDAAGPALGAARWWRAPTLFWWTGAGDAALVGVCAAGVALSAVALAQRALRPILALLLAGYVSLLTVGGPFLSFQWDALLCEAGLLAIALAPPGWRPFRAGGRAAGRGPLLMLRWLLFRLMLLSGLVKLLAESGLPAGARPWRDLTALGYHWWTQPLPNPVAWWVWRLPDGLQAAACAAMFAIELGVPFTVFAPRGVRHAGALLLLLLQALIAATGNYGFFNLLTVALCVACLDDAALGRLPGLARARVSGTLLPPSWRRAGFAPAAAVLVALALVPALFRLGAQELVPEPLAEAWHLVAPFHVANAYGLFARMTTERDEVELEGSDDGREWRPYVFRWKPGPPDRAPPFVAPHMPRLDWQMWFAALSRFERQPWLARLVERLLEGEPTVVALLETDPFAGRRPRFVRARRWRYRFAPPGGAAWWTRELAGEYAPPMSLEPDLPPPADGR